MATNSSTKTVEALKHDEAKRKNIPTAEYQSVLDAEQQQPKQVRYPRNTDLDPQLVWRGKDQQDWSDLVVHAPPLYIQEKVHPKVLIDDLLRSTRERAHEAGQTTPDLFADFNGIPAGTDKTEFYQHDQNWTNRMILGDSLQVMASLAEREGLRGKVQCIYLDPPYGIKFNSNFQWSTTSRDVKDGKADHITREPEQVKAFRDTWRDGIHSYLTYLRDRLTVARDLLTESGSIFVQIGDENVHRVRAVMDEIFGDENFCSLISYSKTSSATAELLPGTNDYILWYAKSASVVKYRQLFQEKQAGGQGASKYFLVQFRDGRLRSTSAAEKGDEALIPVGGFICTSGGLSSQRPPGTLHPHGHRPRRPRPRPHLRFRHHRLPSPSNGAAAGSPSTPRASRWRWPAPASWARAIPSTCSPIRARGQIKEAEVTAFRPEFQPVHGNIRHGFVYERVPHITLKSIANNAEIDVIWDSGRRSWSRCARR
jgi:adenine-specific DNA-methyltransferase